MSDPASSSPESRIQPLLQWCARMRAVLRQGRELLPSHAVFKPNWDLHEQRLGEMERLLREDDVRNEERIDALREDFLLDMNADMAATLSETSERLVRFTDQVAQKFEEKKFELPSEVRDDLEDTLQPYHDIHRDKMLGELPIETRRDIEAAKRRLEEGE